MGGIYHKVTNERVRGALYGRIELACWSGADARSKHEGVERSHNYLLDRFTVRDLLLLWYLLI